jgi:ubiquinone/menaquinone biosynthesis C-methylase UbiE
MSDHFKDIYATKVDQYDAMVSREDYQGNILPALQNIHSLIGVEVVEFGAGTGRLTRLLSPIVGFIYAYDGSRQMLNHARERLLETGFNNWQLYPGDNRRLPQQDSIADIAIAGWSFAHLVGWYPDTWRNEVDKVLNEMNRVTKLNGVMIILETLGTGRESPEPPNEGLARYYNRLENEQGFSHSWIRTDYKFESVDEADKLTRFFFGDELADHILTEKITVLPECTGIWWKSSNGS